MTDAIATAAPYDIARLRATEFPWADRGEAIYLDHASIGPLPTRATDALGRFNALRSTPWRITGELQFGTTRRARELCALLVGADPGEIALMTNTSYGINLAARMLPLGAGDVVLTFDREFPANVYPWMALARSGGARLRIVESTGGLPDEEAMLHALDDPHVKAVTVSWVSFVSGYKVDLARIGAACRERGVYFVVDAIQGVGGAVLDVAECKIDVLACGAQKWLLSPWGTGFVFVRRSLIERSEPVDVGWMAVRNSDDFSRLVDYDLTYRDDARRFEVGTLPFQEFAGMKASLELLLELGVDKVAAHVASLATRVVEWAGARDDVTLVTPADPARRAGIVSVAPAEPREASRRLRRAGVVHSLREGAIRFAPHCYNTEAEIDRALALLGGEARA